MNLKELHRKLREEDFQGCVSYDIAAILFDLRFNVPTTTYFHNVDEYEDAPDGSPESSEWACREENWEMCGSGTFLNYPDNFVVRCRYARPTWYQVAKWLEDTYHMKFDVELDRNRVYLDTQDHPYTSRTYYPRNEYASWGEALEWAVRGALNTLLIDILQIIPFDNDPETPEK